MSLKQEPSQEPLHISAKKLFLIRGKIRSKVDGCAPHIQRDNLIIVSQPRDASGIDELEHVKTMYQCQTSVLPLVSPNTVRQGSGFRVQGAGCRVQGAGVWI